MNSKMNFRICIYSLMLFLASDNLLSQIGPGPVIGDPMVADLNSFSAQESPKISYSLPGKDLMNYPANPVAISQSLPDIDANQLEQLITAEKNTTIFNSVELKILNNFALDEDADIDIKFSLTQYPIDGSPQFTENDIGLAVKFKSGVLQKSNISSIYTFTNAYRVDLNVTYLKVTGEDEVQLKEKLKDFVELSLVFQMKTVSKILHTAIVTDLSSCYDQSTDELIINWKPNNNAVEYDLEYTFVDNYTDNLSIGINPASLTFDFKDNSTRISTKETYYRLPLLFERGFILFRVRIVGYGGTNLNQRVYCEWSGVETGNVKAFPYKYYFSAAHMNDAMDWQSTTTHSEDGKRLDKVTYFDGTFRARQDVTGANLEKQNLPVQSIHNIVAANQNCYVPYSTKNREVIAGETIYDFQGRPSVNILPAPTNSLKIKYIPRLNISEDRQKPYNWEDFDKQDIVCPMPNPLSKNLFNNIMGAASYYSENNPNKYGFNAFIPSADGFAFTQLKYTPDNTGKISVQSGLGLNFKIGSGHETKFFYGSANQYELDRMFGTEVGDEDRYQKNAVIDPNGQVSVTYLNPEGKTIATSLAGDKPTNLVALSSYKEPEEIEVSLISKNEIDQIHKTLITEHQFIVTSPVSKHVFKYTIDPEILDAEKCDGTPVCLDCIYNFEIKLTHAESCDEQIIFNESTTIGALLNANIPDLACNGPPNYTYEDARNLEAGSYILTKKVTVNKQAGIEYVNEVFKDTCRAKWNEILSEELSKIDTMDCYNSCTDCDQPPVQTEVCDTLYCKPNPNRCDIIRGMMMADVSPGGQYAEFNRDAAGNIIASPYPLSIFNRTDIATILGLPAGTKYKTIVNNWIPSYSEKLLMLHPENCKLGWCNEPEIKSTLDFDVKILAAQNYSEAVSKGFINPSSPDISLQLLNADPWFVSISNATLKEILKNYLLQYGCGSVTKSIEVIAEEMAFCAFNYPIDEQEGTPQINTTLLPECIIPTGYLTTHTFGSDNISPGNGKPSLADIEWTLLRSLYLSAKNRIIQSSMEKFPDLTQCDTRCIDDVWNWHGPFGVSGPPCENSGYRYYNKRKRFGSDIKSMFKRMNEEGMNIDMTGIDFDDPCQIAQAIQNQSGNINQQVSSIYCDSTETPCEPNVGLTDLFNSILFQFRDTPLTLSEFELPQSVRSMGITSVNVQKIGMDRMKILFQPMNYSMFIPYKIIDTSVFAPVSACVTNVLSADTGSSFNLKVAYENNLIETIHFNTSLGFTNTGTANNNEFKNSAHATAVSKYLNDIFDFYFINRSFPTPTQLLSMLPAELSIKNGNYASSVSISTSGSLSLTILYPKNNSVYVTQVTSLKRKKGSSLSVSILQSFDTCRIVLSANSTISSWSDAAQVVSMQPDFSASNNLTTTKFIATLLNRSGNITVQVNGSAPCWIMNETSPLRLCDSIPVIADRPYTNRCVEDLYKTAYANASALYQEWVDSMKNDLLDRYYTKCMKAVETLDVTYLDRQYHYTLYYYDQAGNLVKTIPPEGVRLLSKAEIIAVDQSRKNNYNNFIDADHIKPSVYKFNTLNELLWQQTPDGGVTDFYYDALGRIVASKNEEQEAEGSFAYTKYDLLGRIFESGKVFNGIDHSISRNFDNWETFIAGGSNHSEITLTKYDEPYTDQINRKFRGQTNLRKRVASVMKFNSKQNLESKRYFHATHYRYDIAGNVNKLIQDYPNTPIGDKSVEYEYDLHSGKVNRVIYQRGAEDQFIHKYSYDALNRLIRVKTSPNGLAWDTDAEYFYYRHGPLARTELGTDKVQGLDYMYTLQGWIKGVNGTTLDAGTDMGRDGIINPQSGTPKTEVIDGRNFSLYTPAQIFGNGFNGPGYGTLHNPVARDAFGYLLEYFKDDYKPVNPPAGSLPLSKLNSLPSNPKPLYNGNISRMYTQIQKFAETNNTSFDYTYDQLNRFISQKGWALKENSIEDLGEKYSMKMKYDADGNIIKLLRYGEDGNELDNFHYRYYTKAGSTYHLDDANSIAPNNATNKLAQTNDNHTNNYIYSRIGNLISDKSENIDEIRWNMQNKISRITKSGGPGIFYEYDALGNRIMKLVRYNNIMGDNRTYYVRDAQGNILAVYSLKPTDGPPIFKWEEAHIYGSSRLGMYTPDKKMGDPGLVKETDTRGYKQYELTNHLGNVLATITDRKLPETQDGKTTYTADVVTAQDYYPFGMMMSGRMHSSTDYKYGFNGKENDNEVKGTGNQQDYGFRIYDPRLGKFLSMDPINKKFPYYTPYQFAGNKSIQAIDLDGLEEWIRTDYFNSSNQLYKTQIEMVKANSGRQIVHNSIIRENNDNSFTKFSLPSTEATNGNNPFGNDPLGAYLRQRALNLDQNNNPAIHFLRAPVQITTRVVGTNAIRRQLAFSYQLVPNSLQSTSAGFGKMFFDLNGNFIGPDASGDVIKNNVKFTVNSFNRSVDYSNTIPVNDYRIPESENAIQQNPYNRGGPIEIFSNGNSKPMPMGSDLLDKAKGGDGDNVNLNPP
jgi:RHS repeat-associated protein